MEEVYSGRNWLSSVKWGETGEDEEDEEDENEAAVGMKSE
jgi:hypothetical protein